MTVEDFPKIHSINESTLKVPINHKKFYSDRDFYLAYPMSHSARGYINDVIDLCRSARREDLINEINVAQVEIICGIYLLDACGTHFSPIKKALKPKLDHLITDEPGKALSDSNKLMLNFSDRKVAADVQKNLEEFDECYEYLRRNVFTFDFRHSELRSMLDVFSNRFSDYWRSYIEHLVREKKLLRGSTPSHIFWGYNQFAVPYDIKVREQTKSFKATRKVLEDRAAVVGFETVAEMNNAKRKAKQSLRRKEKENRERQIQLMNQLMSDLDSISCQDHSRDRNKAAYDWVANYTRYLIEERGMQRDEAEDHALHVMEQKVYYKA
jgi:hypothetical protein